MQFICSYSEVFSEEKELDTRFLHSLSPTNQRTPEEGCLAQCQEHILPSAAHTYQHVVVTHAIASRLIQLPGFAGRERIVLRLAVHSSLPRPGERYIRTHI